MNKNVKNASQALLIIKKKTNKFLVTHTITSTNLTKYLNPTFEVTWHKPQT